MNYLFLAPAFDNNAWHIVFCVSVSVVAAILIDGLFAAVVRWLLPSKWFAADKECWAAGRKERRLYDRLGIKGWKDKVIELGAFTGFRKNKIADPTNNEYVERYILEANYGVLCHIFGLFVGYLIIFIFPEHWYSVGLPVGFVNMVLNSLPLMILRYNLPKLHTLRRINAKRARREQNAEDAEMAEDAPSSVA